jgi:hypothetical protein
MNGNIERGTHIVVDGIDRVVEMVEVVNDHTIRITYVDDNNQVREANVTVR